MDRGRHRKSPSADGLPTPGPVHLKRTLRDDAQWTIRYLPARSIFIHSRAPDTRQSSHVLFPILFPIPCECCRISAKLIKGSRILSDPFDLRLLPSTTSFGLLLHPSTAVDPLHQTSPAPHRVTKTHVTDRRCESIIRSCAPRN